MPGGREVAQRLEYDGPVGHAGRQCPVGVRGLGEGLRVGGVHLGLVAALEGLLGPLLIGASRLPPRIFLPLNIVGALVWALLFTTIGYLGGEVVGPWLHHLDAHLKHWIWLILAVVVVVAAHWWLRRRESKKKD